MSSERWVDRDPMPVFTIKGKDALAYPAITAYHDLLIAHGLHGQAQECLRARTEIREWQKRNIDATKLPDHKHVPAVPTPSGGEG